MDLIEKNEAHNEGYDVGYWAGRRDYEKKWIPCSERLPSEDAYYLVTLGNGIAEDGQDIEMCAWADGHWDWWNSDLVLAWMLQPEPWKGEQNE